LHEQRAHQRGILQRNATGTSMEVACGRTG
jgi:hypothetical protein